MENLKLFESKNIRTVWDDDLEEWYFSIVDVVSVLTDSADSSAYWRKMKQRLNEEGNETVTNCHSLKMTAADGKMDIVKKSVHEPFGFFAFLLLYTGCRRGEALALQFKDIDVENKKIYIRKSVMYTGNVPEIKTSKKPCKIGI